MRTALVDGGAREVLLVTRRKSEALRRVLETEDGAVRLIDYAELEEIRGELLVNATPVGMYPDVDSAPVTARVAAHFAALVDTVYNPKETRLMCLGQKAGCQTAGGLYMLAAQAAGAQELWQGRTIGETILDEIYLRLQNTLASKGI